MLKNNKIFIFLAILFIVLFLFTSSVFASTETYSFNGFDGTTYNLTPLPEGVNDYKHYVLLKNNTVFYLYCFNNSIRVTRDDNYLTVSTGDDSSGKIYQLAFNNASSWTEQGYSSSYSSNIKTTSIIVSCNDLLQYKDNFVNDNDFFYNPPIVEPTGTLAPIVETTPLEGVLEEIVGILPVVLMILVGLIGLRKALKFLLTVLHLS